MLHYIFHLTYITYVCQVKNTVLNFFYQIYSETLLNAAIPRGTTSCKYFSSGVYPLYTLDGILVFGFLSSNLNPCAIWWVSSSISSMRWAALVGLKFSEEDFRQMSKAVRMSAIPEGNGVSLYNERFFLPAGKPQSLETR